MTREIITIGPGQVLESPITGGVKVKLDKSVWEAFSSVIRKNRTEKEHLFFIKEALLEHRGGEYRVRNVSVFVHPGGALSGNFEAVDEFTLYPEELCQIRQTQEEKEGNSVYQITP